MATKLLLAQPEPAITEWQVTRVVLDRDAEEVIVRVRSNTGVARDIYLRDQGCALIDELTSGDLSETSLDARLLARLVADGHFEGEVVEEPEEEEAQA